MLNIEPNQQPYDILSHSDTSQLPTRVVVGDLDHPLVEIAPWQPEAIQQGEPVALDSDQRSSISALLNQLPGLMQSMQGAFSQTYRLTFTPEVMQKMSGVMKAVNGGERAIAIGPKGEILGHGVLHPTNSLKALSAATAVWQGLAIATAQIHLIEINARLAQIEQGIDTIKAMLEAEQVSKLVTGLRYVREVSEALAQGDVSEHECSLIAAQIGTIWLECGQVAHTCLQLLGRNPQDFPKQQLSAWYDLDQSAALAKKAVTAYERRASVYLMALYVRSATVVLRERLGLSRTISESHSVEIRNGVADWRDNRKAFFGIAKERISTDLSATFSKQVTIDSGRRKLMAYAGESKDRLDNQCNRLEQTAIGLQDRLKQPLDLVVTLDQDGQIVNSFQLTQKERV